MTTTAAQGVDGKVLALRLLREGLHVKLISDRTALMPKEIVDIARRNGMGVDEDGVPHVLAPSRAPAPTGGPPMRPIVVPSPQQVAEVVQIRQAVRDLLVAARASSSKATVRLAERADALLQRIRDRVEAEQRAEQEREEKRRQAEAEKARALAEREAEYYLYVLAQSERQGKPVTTLDLRDGQS